MGVDLYMAGFTASPFARCAPYRREIMGLYHVEGDWHFHKMGAYTDGPYRHDDTLPREPTEERWAIRWRWDPAFEIGGFLSKQQFEAALVRAQASAPEQDIGDTNGVSLWDVRWDQSSPASQQEICAACPVRHPEGTDCDQYLGGMGSLGLICNGLAALFHRTPQLAGYEVREMQQAFAALVRKEPADLPPLEAPLLKAVRELITRYNLNAEDVIERGRDGLGFYEGAKQELLQEGARLIIGDGPEIMPRHDFVSGFFGAFIFPPDDEEMAFSQDDMAFLLPRFRRLAEACDDLIWLVEPGEREAVQRTRQFLETFTYQFDIALRFGLRVRVSA